MLVNNRKLRSWVTTQLLKVRAVLAGVDAVRYDVGSANVEL